MAAVVEAEKWQWVWVFHAPNGMALRHGLQDMIGWRPIAYYLVDIVVLTLFVQSVTMLWNPLSHS